MLRRPVLVALAVAMLVTAGCSGKEKNAKTSPVPSESFEVRAKRAVLQPGDLPEGWAKVPASSDHEQAWAGLRACVSEGGALDPGAVSATSGVFAAGGARAESTVAYVGADQANEFAVSLLSTGSSACMEAALAAEAGRNAPQGSAVRRHQVALLQLARPAGAAAWGVRSTATYSSGSMVVTDVVVLAKEGALSRLVFVNDGGPFSEDLERALVEKVASRS